MDPLQLRTGGAYARSIPHTKQKKAKRSKEPEYPPGYEELLSLDPRSLVEVEEDYIDIRNQDTSNFSATGRAVYMSPEDVPVGLWDPTKVRKDAAFILFGKRRSGKSHLARELCYIHKGTFDRALVFTGTKHNGFYQRVPREYMPPSLRDKRLGFVPDKAVIQGFDEYRLNRFMQLQTSIFEFEDIWRESMEYEPEAIVIVDDCIGDKEVQASGYGGGIVDLFALGRHFDVMAVWLTQYPRSVSTIMRDNTEWAVVFKLESDLAYEAITKTYMGELNPLTAKALIRMYTKGEKDGARQCLVIDMDPHTPAHEKYFTYSCVSEEDLPDFVIGSEKFQKECAFDNKEYLDRKRKVLSYRS